MQKKYNKSVRGGLSAKEREIIDDFVASEKPNDRAAGISTAHDCGKRLRAGMDSVWNLETPCALSLGIQGRHLLEEMLLRDLLIL